MDPQLQAKIQKAKAAGYSDEEIKAYIGSHATANTGASNDALQVSGMLSQPSPTQPSIPQQPTPSMNQPMPTIPQVKPATNGYGYANDGSQGGHLNSVAQDKAQGKNPSFMDKVGNVVTDWLPTIGSIGGGVLGGMAGIESGPGAIATAAGGAALGGAGGEALKEKIKKEKLNPANIAVQGALGGVGEGVGGVVAKVGGKVAGTVLPKIVSKISEFGGDVALGGIKASKAQQKAFFNNTGTKLDEYLINNKLAGQGAQGIAAHVGQLQDAYDSVVLNKGLTVDSQEVVDTIAKRIQDLKKNSSIPGNSQKAAELEQTALKFINDHGDQSALPIETLTKLRRGVDDTIKNNQFNATVANPAREYRNLLNDTIYNAADKAGLTVNGTPVRNAGMELKKAYEAQKIATDNQFSSKATVPGISTLLQGGLGATIGGATNKDNSGMGALEGAVGGIALTKLATNPRVLGLASKFLTSIGSKQAGTLTNAAGNIAAKTTGQVGTSSTFNALNKSGSEGQFNPNTTNGNNKQTDNSHTSTIPQNTDQGGAVTIDPQSGHMNFAPLNAKTVPQDYSTAQYMADLEKPENKFVAANKAVLDIKYQTSKTNAQKKIDAQALPAEDASFMQHAPHSGALLDRAGDYITKLGTNPVYANKTLKTLREQTNGDVAAMDALLNQLSQISEKSAVGGRLSNFDQQLGATFMPQPGDTVAAAMAKLHQAKALLKDQYDTFYPKYGMTVGE